MSGIFPFDLSEALQLLVRPAPLPTTTDLADALTLLTRPTAIPSAFSQIPTNSNPFSFTDPSTLIALAQQFRTAFPGNYTLAQSQQQQQQQQQQLSWSGNNGNVPATGGGAGDGPTPAKRPAPTNEQLSGASPPASCSSSVTSSSSQNSPHRKQSAPVPDEKKDEAYYERRRKNNDAAKRSRDARRQKEEAVAARAAFLEQENIQLRSQVVLLKNETAKLQLMLFSKPELIDPKLMSMMKLDDFRTLRSFTQSDSDNTPPAIQQH